MQALRSLLSLPQLQLHELEGSLDEPVIGHARDELDKGLPQRPDSLQAFTARRQSAEYSANLAPGRMEAKLAFHRQHAVPAGFGGARCWPATTRATRSASSSPTCRCSRRPVHPPAAASRSRRCARPNTACGPATDNARLELESAWTSLEASAEVVATQEKALELARESVQIAQVLGTRTASSPPPSSMTPRYGCYRPSGC